MRRIIVCFVAILIAITLRAQLPVDTTVSIVTFHAGKDVYELEGHTALRIRTPQYDVAVSYGNFDFNTPGFVYRFVKGETDYWVDAAPWRAALWAYQQQGRRIVEQQIDMTPSQKERLISLVQENLLPQNRVYRYNYVRDNCAMRPLQIVERAMGDSVILASVPSEMENLDTWRKLMSCYHRNYPWYQFGIDLALGSGLDRKLSNREKAYAPVLLQQQLAGATVGGRKVVKDTKALNDVAEDAAVDKPTPFLLSPMFAMLVLALVIVQFAVCDFLRKSLSRVVICLTNLLTGINGLVLTFLIFVSTHEATSPNWLYLWLNPLGIAIAICVWRKSWKKLLFWLQIVNFALIFSMLICWPFTGQRMNPALWPMFVAYIMQTASCIYVLKKQLEPTAHDKD